MTDSGSGEKCSAEYVAKIVHDLGGKSKVFIVALGFHPTSGYEVFFRKEPMDEYPPVFSLWHKKPEGSADVITPFSKVEIIDATTNMKEIRIRDAKGTHHVPIIR